MKLSPEKREEIRRAVDLQDVIERATGLVFKGGKAKMGECPFCHHGQKTACFEVRPEIGSYRCRSGGCGAHGDVFQWLMDYEGLPFPEAARKAAGLGGVALPEDPRAQPVDPAEEAARQAAKARDDALRRALTAAAAWFRENLAGPGGEACRAYLERRGWSEAVDAWGLGYAPDDWQALVRHLESQGVPQEVRLAAGLTALAKPKEGAPEAPRREYAAFRGRMTGEVLDDRGRLCAFWARLLPGGAADAPKVLNTPEIPGVFVKGEVLFGLWQARPALRRLGFALLLEGQGDTVTCHLAEHEHAVATCGTALTLAQAKLLRRYVPHVAVGYDGDDAGRKATELALELLWQAGLTTSVVELPEGEDPDSFLHPKEEAA